jgi:hypothetical protein
MLPEKQMRNTRVTTDICMQDDDRDDAMEHAACIGAACTKMLHIFPIVLAQARLLL